MNNNSPADIQETKENKSRYISYQREQLLSCLLEKVDISQSIYFQTYSKNEYFVDTSRALSNLYISAVI
jgi:hypothetical protein